MWDYKDTLAVLLIAAVTATISLAVLSPSPASATDKDAKAAEVSDPKLVTDDGLVIRLKADKTAYAAGDKPKFILMIENSGKEQIETVIQVNIMAMGESNTMSRRGPIPESIWKKDYNITVASGKTETVDIITDCALPAGENIMVTVTRGKQRFTAFQTTTPKDESDQKQNATAEKQN